MLAPDQVNLGERVEDRAGRLAHELQRAADVEGTIQRLLGAIEAAEPDADLPERRERHAEPMRRAPLLLQLDAALREAERLLVTVLHQRHVRLIAADRRQDVDGLDEQRKPLGLRQRRHGLFEPPFLRERDSRQRVHHRQVPPVANGVKRRCCLGEVLADDRHVADLAIAEAQLEVGQADGARIVGALGGLQGLGQESDAAGRLAPCGREAAVHTPEVGYAGGIEAFPRFGRSPEGVGCLPDVVLEQPGVRQRAADLALLLPPQPWPLQRAHQQRRRFSAAPALQRLHRLPEEIWTGHGGDSIPRIQAPGSWLLAPGSWLPPTTRTSCSSRSPKPIEPEA